MLAAARHHVRRVVLAGSSSIYGIPDTLPCRETMRPDPQSPYGTSKLAAEGYVHTLGKLHGIETVVLRYFNVFGPGQDPASEYAAVVPRFTMAVLEGRRPQVNGSGEISRDFTYVDNVVSANLLASLPDRPSGADLQRRMRRPAQPARPPRGDRPGGRPSGRPGVRTGPRRRHPRFAGGHQRRPTRRSATRSSCRSWRA